MKNLIILCLAFMGFSMLGQTNLALTATPSASASSSGSYGPSNWNDGVINGSTFGWVGTSPSFPTPAYMEFTWTSPQTIDSVRIFNVGTNFAPPNGNGVVFTGTADLEYHDGSQWNLITTFSGQGGYGAVYYLKFNPISTNRLRIVNINTGTNPADHNPGFDEIEIYLSPQPAPIRDIALLSIDTTLRTLDTTLVISAVIENVGNQNIDTVEISYELSNSTSVVSQTFFPLLAPGSDTVLVLSQAIDLQNLPSPISSENLCVWADTRADTNQSNDSLCISLINLNIDEVSPSNEVKIYPNPSDGWILVRSSFLMNQISIMDIHGKVLFSMDVDHENSISVRTEELPTGIYLINLRGDRISETQKLIIE